MTAIPVLSLDEPDFEAQLLEACRTVGFVALRGHNIDATLFAQMRSLLVALFDSDKSAKRTWAITPDNYRGFIPLGFFTPNRAEASGILPDLYEGFKLHWECETDHPARTQSRLYGKNRWLPHLPQMREIISAYWDGCDHLTHRLLPIFANHMNIDPAVFTSWFDAPLSNMTLLHYPPQPPHSAASGIHPHKDTNVITYLYPDPVGGLQVRDIDGTWIEANPPPDTVLMNIGEMLELWSGGEFVATPHRVINTSGSDRYSYPWFLVPNHQVVVAPLVDCTSGFRATTMPVGALSEEVWRTNWPDEVATRSEFDLGTLDR